MQNKEFYKLLASGMIAMAILAAWQMTLSSKEFVPPNENEWSGPIQAVAIDSTEDSTTSLRNRILWEATSPSGEVITSWEYVGTTSELQKALNNKTLEGKSWKSYVSNSSQASIRPEVAFTNTRGAQRWSMLMFAFIGVAAYAGSKLARWDD